MPKNVRDTACWGTSIKWFKYCRRSVPEPNESMRAWMQCPRMRICLYSEVGAKCQLMNGDDFVHLSAIQTCWERKRLDKKKSKSTNHYIPTRNVNNSKRACKRGCQCKDTGTMDITPKVVGKANIFVFACWRTFRRWSLKSLVAGNGNANNHK